MGEQHSGTQPWTRYPPGSRRATPAPPPACMLPHSIEAGLAAIKLSFALPCPFPLNVTRWKGLGVPLQRNHKAHQDPFSLKS